MTNGMLFEAEHQQREKVYEILKNVEDTKTNFSKKFTPESNDDRETLENFFSSVDSVVEKYSDGVSNCVLMWIMVLRLKV